jgi:hypothetical protein
MGEDDDDVPKSLFRKYRRSQIAELRRYQPGMDTLEGVSIAAVDKLAGSPQPGDMIARNPKNHADQWLVAAQYFADNFELPECHGCEWGAPLGDDGMHILDVSHKTPCTRFVKQ